MKIVQERLYKLRTIWIINQEGSTPTTGYGGRNYYFARELSRRGYRVFYIIASWHHLLNSNIKKLPRVERDDQLTIIRIPVLKYKKSSSIVRMLNWEIFKFSLMSIHKKIQYNPDVIYYSSLSLVGVTGAIKLKKQFGCKLCFEVRDIWPMSLKELQGLSEKNLYVRYLQNIEDFAYLEADFVISNLKFAYTHMVSRGMDRNKFTWIPNGVSIDDIIEKENLPSEANVKFPQRTFIVGYCGSLNIATTPVNMIEAAKILKYNEQIKFVICGDGAEKKRILSIVEKYELDNVTFIDKVKKKYVQAIISKFDVCYLELAPLATFKYGVSPNKLFDYLAAAKPIIYAIDSGRYTPVLDAGCGEQVDPDDPSEIARVILKFSAMDKNMLSQMGLLGRKYFESNHIYETLVNRLEAIFFDDASVVLDINK